MTAETVCREKILLVAERMRTERAEGAGRSSGMVVAMPGFETFAFPAAAGGWGGEATVLATMGAPPTVRGGGSVSAAGGSPPNASSSARAVCGRLAASVESMAWIRTDVRSETSGRSVRRFGGGFVQICSITAGTVSPP